MAFKHGLWGTLIYKVWKSMVSRCHVTTATDYKNYGGRGIKVCDEWRHDPMAFYAYMGDRPTPDHSLDRIDVNGNYEPGNVRWATRSEQALNRRRPTACKRGHEFTPENTYVWRDGPGYRRACRTCQRELVRRYKERKRAAA